MGRRPFGKVTNLYGKSIRYLKAIFEMAEEGTLRLERADGRCSGVTNNLAGFMDDEYYYVRLERTLQEVNRHYDRLNQPLNITADALSKMLLDQKILEPQKGARTKKKVSFCLTTIAWRLRWNHW